MSSLAETSNLMSRNTIGVTFTLLSGVGVILLPTTAKLSYESGSNLITVAFARGVIATLILLLVARLIFGEAFTALQWLGFATVLVSLLMFEILVRSD